MWNFGVVSSTSDHVARELPELKGHVLASLFRPAFVRSLLQNNHNGILQEMGVMTLAGTGASLAELFECAYTRLLQTYRCEYVYKNEIVRELFLRRHDPATASLASEFPIENNRADLLVINATTVAYEVKTHYDALERLPAQTSAYLSVFDRVNVVCDPSFVDRVKELVDDRIGVISFRDNGSLKTERECTSNADKIDPAAVFGLLRAPEYIKAVRQLFGIAPKVPNTQRRKAYLTLFRTLPAQTAHAVLVEVLRARFADHRPSLINSVPHSMGQMYYEANINTRGRIFDSRFLNRPSLTTLGDKK